MDTGAGHADLVPDELVELFALAGTESECANRIADISKLQIDQMSAVPFVPPGESRDHTIRRFASAVDSVGSSDGLR
jgi:5,10-methylenetetrahydromethanopterin reductase